MASSVPYWPNARCRLRWGPTLLTGVVDRPARKRRGRPAAAWKAYAVGSEVDHFAEFCREHLIQSVDEWDGLPLVLEPFQRRMMGEALAFDDRGWPVWRRVVIVMPRKNGKTQLLAAYALYRLLTQEGSPEILLAASSDKQAGRLYDAAATFVRRSAMLRELCRPRDHVGEIVREDGRGVIYRLSSDPARLHGYNPSLVVCDELAQWVTPSLRRAFAALTSGGGARSAPQVFTITVAGEARDREDSILGRMLDQAQTRGDVEESPGLRISRLWPARMLVYNHEAPTSDPHDVAAMKLANPASWVSEAYLAEQAEDPELTDAEVLQLHGCVWAAGQTQWLPGGAWRACQVDAEPPEDGSDVVLGFDGSYNRDSTGLVGCTPDGHVFMVGVWERPARAAKDWTVPRHEVHKAVDDAMRSWNVLELACDPNGWHSELAEWEERYGSPPVVVYEPKPSNMDPACSRFHSAVLTKTLTHDGDPVLARHLANAVLKETRDGAYITKDGRNSPRKIDVAVAAVIAFDRAAQFEGRAGFEAYDPDRIEELIAAMEGGSA